MFVGGSGIPTVNTQQAKEGSEEFLGWAIQSASWGDSVWDHCVQEMPFCLGNHAFGPKKKRVGMDRLHASVCDMICSRTRHLVRICGTKKILLVGTELNQEFFFKKKRKTEPGGVGGQGL